MDPCSQIERIIKTEAMVMQLVPMVNTIDKKLDEIHESISIERGREEVLKENPQIKETSKGFIAGILAVGSLIGIGSVTALKPFIAVFFQVPK